MASFQAYEVSVLTISSTAPAQDILLNAVPPGSGEVHEIVIEFDSQYVSGWLELLGTKNSKDEKGTIPFNIPDLIRRGFFDPNSPKQVWWLSTKRISPNNAKRIFDYVIPAGETHTFDFINGTINDGSGAVADERANLGSEAVVLDVISSDDLDVYIDEEQTYLHKKIPGGGGRVNVAKNDFAISPLILKSVWPDPAIDPTYDNTTTQVTIIAAGRDVAAPSTYVLVISPFEPSKVAYIHKLALFVQNRTADLGTGAADINVTSGLVTVYETSKDRGDRTHY